ncbi:hypothetical protein DPMN_144968 [Dreissena polymorpha]|uniref:Uncharacterized protein n=1 Tax=Dreissena polymorpha TaxID=45954 RepID=A0A9D4J0V2_DREPO|nr:hypothetical protein DPMN_144968 [Dreissena polymorpha]
MGVDLVTYRARIGVFTMPCKSKLSVSEIRLSRNGVSARLRVIIALSVLLLLCGDVEQNPGPSQRPATRQQKLSFSQSSQSSRLSSPPPPPGRDPAPRSNENQ